MLGELCPSRPTQPRDALRRPRGACGDRRSAGGFFLRSSQSVGRTRILRFDLCAVSQLLRFLATAQDIPADLLIEGSFRAERRRIHPLPAFHICGRAINTHRGRIRSRLSACSWSVPPRQQIYQSTRLMGFSKKKAGKQGDSVRNQR